MTKIEAAPNPDVRSEDDLPLPQHPRGELRAQRGAAPEAHGQKPAPRPQVRATIAGVGHYLPPRIVPNAEFAQTLETSDEWIVTRTGIERRHFAGPEDTTASMAAKAATAALAHAGHEAETLDAIVVATSTPDLTFPSVATMVQAEIGATRSFAFDIQAVCAGFIYALAQANALIVAQMARRILVIGSETFSRILDMQDRSTAVLFGDGAGAVLLEAEDGSGTSSDRGILGIDLHADGHQRRILYVDGGVATTGTAGHLRMAGREVFRHAVEKLAQTAEAALAAAQLSPKDVDWLVPHQANLRIIQATAQKLGLPMEKVIVTVQDHGNTSAASIPLALSVAAQAGRFRPGELLLLEAIGGGLVWGAIALRW